MKKLLVVALSAIMVLSMAAVSMAAVAVGGEFNFGYKTEAADTLDSAISSKPDKGTDFIESKVTVAGDLNDNLEVFAAIKTNGGSENGGSRFFNDELWAKLKYDAFNLQVGYFGFGFGGPKDILDAAYGDFKAEAGLLASYKFTDTFTGKLYYGYDNDFVFAKENAGVLTTNALDGETGDGAVAVGFDYTADALSVGLIYAQPKVKFDGDVFTSKYETKSIIAANVSYAFGVFKPYISYSTNAITNDAGKDVDNTVTIVGFTLESADMPFYARAEYDLDSKDDVAGWKKDLDIYGIRLGYKLNANAAIEGQFKTVANTTTLNDTNNDTYIKLKVTF